MRCSSTSGRWSTLVVQARGRTGELMGVVVAALDLGFVRDVIAAARLGPGARVLVVDGAGVPVATSDRARPSPQSLAGRDPVVDRALASTVEGTLSADGWVSAYRNLSSYQSLRGVRWAIIHQQPEAEAYALARRTTRDTMIIGARRARARARARRVLRDAADAPARRRSRARADAIAAGQATDGRADRRPRRDRRARAVASTRWRSGSPSAPSSRRRSRAAIGSRRSA